MHFNSMEISAFNQQSSTVTLEGFSGWCYPHLAVSAAGMTQPSLQLLGTFTADVQPFLIKQNQTII